jgi:CelD/BcsL family acetyltransferase involved in cellulose biosynthesis
MRASLVTAFDRELALAEWSRLYAAAGPNFFQSPPFVSAWLAAAGTGVGLLRVEADGAPIALGFVGAATGGPLGREARLGETGQKGLDRLYVEYQDFLLAPGAGDAARDAAIDALVDGAPDVSDFVVRNARPALSAAFARGAARRGLDFRILRTQPTFAVDLGEAGAGISSSLAAKIRRSLRRYEERGPVRVGAAATAAARAAAFRDLIGMHEPYWNERGEPGAFADPQLRAFHERFIEAAPEAVDLLRVSAGEETIGVLYNFVAGDRVYNYQSGMRREDDNQFAPGFTAHWLAIGRYRAKGFAAYDLMAGEADYKRRLAREGETLTSLVIERRGVLQRAKSLARSFRRARTRQT